MPTISYRQRKQPKEPKFAAQPIPAPKFAAFDEAARFSLAMRSKALAGVDPPIASHKAR